MPSSASRSASEPVNVHASMVPMLGGFASLVDALCIFREDRRCIHDLIAGTRVIEYRTEGAA